jgi:peptidoglycan/LPS O-acetylase OafA/YrhL
MLTYAYTDLNRARLRRFYWRRFLSVGIPYLCWSVIYFLCTLPVSHYPSTTVAFRGLASIVETGYYQLYFLLVIMQFYLVFPLVLVLLRRTRGHHGLVIVVTLLAQVAIAIGMHWNLFPREMVRFGQQDALSYLLYLVGGCVVAFHFDQVHAWVCAHARLVVALTAAAALAAEGIYFLAAHGVITVLVRAATRSSPASSRSMSARSPADTWRAWPWCGPGGLGGSRPWCAPARTTLTVSIYPTCFSSSR